MRYLALALLLASPLAHGEKGSFAALVRTKLHLSGIFLKGAPAAIKKGVATRLKGSTPALRRVESMSDGQLARLPEGERADLARALLHPNLLQRFTHKEERSAELLRVVTARGTGAGQVDAVLSRVGYLENIGAKLSGAPKQEFQSLLEKDRAAPGDWKGFGRYLDAATHTRARAGTRVEPLINGEVAFPRMQAAIDGAKKSVNVSVYAFQSDKAGWEFAQHMAAAAARGVRVRLLYDPYGSQRSAGAPTDPAVYTFLRAHGVEVVEWPSGPFMRQLTHRKITVVDGDVAFTGGMNVGDEYKTTWHDVNAQVTGRGVADFQKLFVSEWQKAGGKLAPGDAHVRPSAADPTGGTARVIGHESRADQNIKLAYLRAIDTAQREIHVADPYFSDREVMAHLEQAAHRGVAVSIVFPKTNDLKLEQAAERNAYGELLHAGVEIYEYHGRPMAHDKVATFDGQISTIGSSNLDARSMWGNYEANVWSQDPAVARRLDQELFTKDIAESDRITRPVGGVLQHIRDKIGAMLGRSM